jgi:ABC-2 type transport system permease protein
MWAISIKEFYSFFHSITGYLAVALLLLVTGLFLFVFPDTSLLNFGYATMQGFFTIMPYVLAVFVPVVTMRSFAEERKTGTFELLKTYPLSPIAIVAGKFWGVLLVLVLTLLPTWVYALALQLLSATGGIDWQSTAASYIGLICLCAVFAAAGIFSSIQTNNTVVGFLLAVLWNVLLYFGIAQLAMLQLLPSTANYLLEFLGAQWHYKSISRGVLALNDVLYFATIVGLFGWYTTQKFKTI